MRRLLPFIVAGLVVTSAVAVGRSFYEFNQTQTAPVTAQTSPVSTPVAQDKTVIIDINDRFEYWHNIGWETVPKIFDPGDPNDVEDDVSNRAVRDDLIFNGWQRMIDYSQEMVDLADARMIQLHNPFGSASFVDQDLENGAEFPVPGPDGEIDGKPGRRIMQFSQYTDSLHEWTMNESWAAEHWADFGGQPAMHATLGLWTDFLERNPGVRVRFYVGGPHNDFYVKNLVAEYGTSSQEVWDHIWANLVPYLLVGIRDIGVDNSSSQAARNSGVTSRMMDVLFHPEKRDPVLDADLIAAIGNEPVEVMIEAKPWKDAYEQFDYDVLAEEFVWKAFTAPNNLHFPPDDYYIRGRGVRLLTRETVDGETVPVRSAERFVTLARDVLTSGHYVMISYFWAKLTGVETTQKLLDGVGLFEMPTQINLLSNANSDTDIFTIIQEPQHGTLTINPNYPYIFHYTSRSDFTGGDSFTYQVSNDSGQTSAPATVTIQQLGHQYTPLCGNTFIEDGEECDDGNTVNGDSCSADCREAVHLSAPARENECISETKLNLKQHIIYETEERMQDPVPGGHRNLYSVIDTTNHVLEYNPNSWLSDLDLTGHAPMRESVTGGNASKGGALISPRHVLVAKHTNHNPGEKMYFFTKENQLIMRTVEKRTNIEFNGGATDIDVVYLDEDLPPSIKPFRVLPPDFLTFDSGLTIGTPTAELSDFTKTTTSDTKSLVGGLIWQTGSTDDPLRALYHEHYNGGSSSPVMFIINDEPILLGTRYVTYGDSIGSPAVSVVFDEVNAVMAEQEGPDGPGYQLNAIDLNELSVQLCGAAAASVCGNQIIEHGEECDDGNTDNHDGCSSACIDEAVSYAYAWRRPSVDLPHIIFTPQVDGAGGDYINQTKVQAIIDAVSTQPEVAIWGNVHHDHIVPWHIPSDVGNLDNAKTPDGTLTEHNGIWWDNWTTFTAQRFHAFLQLYRNLGGPPINYVQLDVEHGFSNWSFLGNRARADAVENDPRFAAVRTEMLTRGIEWKGNFYDTIHYQNGTINYLLWNQYAAEKRKEYIEQAYLDVVRQYYPDVEMGNWEGKYLSPEYPVRDFNGHRNWLGGSGAIVGTLQNSVFYFQVGQISNVKLDGVNLFAKTPYNAFLYDVNRVRAPILTDPSTPARIWFGKEQWHTDIGTQDGYDTGTYYEEGVLHTLLAGADGIDYWNTSGPNDINEQAVKMNGLLEEFDQLTRFSLDRTTLNEDLVAWDASYILSGMQTGETVDDYRLYRFTPNIDNDADPITGAIADVQSYKVSSTPPVFVVGDTTIVFPEGSVVSEAGSFAENGFWIQQPLEADLPTSHTDCVGMDCIDDEPDFSDSPCLFCYLSPNVPVEMQHQQAWPTADMSPLGIRTGETVSINSYVFGVGGSESFDAVVGRSEASVRSILLNQIENGVLKTLGIDYTSTKTVIIDIEGAIHPIRWNALTPEQLQQAQTAYAMRVRVAREELPNAKLLVWGIPALHNQQQNVDGSHWQNFLSIYEQAKNAGIFEYVDGLAVQMYVGLGRDDLSFFKVFDGAIQATIEVAGRITKQDGTRLEVYPVISPKNFNGGSNNVGEFHLPEDFAKTIAIMNEYPDIVDGILIWIAGSGNTDQINYLGTLPYCGPDVCSAEPTDVCAQVCALQPVDCPEGTVLVPECRTTGDCDVCQAIGTSPICGNGIIESGEQCDDENAVDFDACTNNCRMRQFPLPVYSCPLPQNYWEGVQ